MYNKRRIFKMKLELTSKERAQLRSEANDYATIIQIGKDGISPETIKVADMALEARELIKLRTLDGAPVGTREAADMIAERTDAGVVSVVGSRFVLYRPSKKNKNISEKLKSKQKK